MGSTNVCRRGLMCEHRINSPGKCRTSETRYSLALKEKCVLFLDSAFSAPYSAAHTTEPSPCRKPYQSTFSCARRLRRIGWQSVLQMERPWKTQHRRLHRSAEYSWLLSQAAARCAQEVRPQLIWARVILKIKEHSSTMSSLTAYCKWHIEVYHVSRYHNDRYKIFPQNNSCISISL